MTGDDNVEGSRLRMNQQPKLAVLIDGENISPLSMKGLFQELHQRGEPFIRRIYGDFSGSQLRDWREMIHRHDLEPRQQFAVTTGKNATDIRLTIDAMDLLHAGQAQAYCLVSSDGDFAPLATRIREGGLDVHGFGAEMAAASFRRACTRFTYLENLHPDAPANNPVSKQKPLRPATDAVPILAAAIASACGHEGWVTLDELGQTLAREHTDFDTRSFGFASLRDLIRKLPRFQIDDPKHGVIRVRRLPKKRRFRRATSPALCR